MGSVAGSLERCYHGLLIEAGQPPLGRRLRLTKLDPTVRVGGHTVELDANAWKSGAVSPDGSPWLESFRLDLGLPVWTFLVHGRRLERTVAMVPGEHTVVVAWRLVDDGPPIELRLRALGSLRSHHGTAWDDGPVPKIGRDGSGLIVQYDDVPPLRLDGAGTWSAGDGSPYRDFHLQRETDRGLGDRDSHRNLGDLGVELSTGRTVHVVASTEPSPSAGADGLAAARSRATSLLAKRPSGDPPEVAQLVLAADAFLVRRRVRGEDGQTVIAGYPWFGDWGRDTFIALPGLTLSTGRPEVAASVLRTFASFVDQGMLPNRFPGGGSSPEYNTVDASLWFFRAAELAVEASSPALADALVRDLLPALEDVVAGYRTGTRYGIRVEADGLVTSGEPGVQLTWMDARVHGREVTPRTGKCVEINALWIHALDVLTRFRRRADHEVGDLEAPLTAARRAFARFWNEETGALFDLIHGPDGDDPAIRPNQVIAASLPTCPLSTAQRDSLLAVCGHHLLTSFGLRSLSPEHPAYVGSYGGPPEHRDAAYHQGTGWSWLIGPWVRARLLAGHAQASVRADLYPLLAHTWDGVVGSVSEIHDGDPPFQPQGAPAQAWSVAELLAAWDLVA